MTLSASGFFTKQMQKELDAFFSTQIMSDNQETNGDELEEDKELSCSESDCSDSDAASSNED